MTAVPTANVAPVLAVTPATGGSVPAPVPPPPAPPIPTPTPAPQPTPAPAPVPIAPLSVVDSSVLTVTLNAGVINIRLTDLNRDTWMRVVLPDGSVSDVTTGPYCACLGLDRHLVSTINIGFLPGIRVEFSDHTEGPWKLAVTTQAPGTSPAPPPSLTLGDTSLVTTTLSAGTVTVELADDHVGAWLRLVMKDGSVSPLTISPACTCIGLGEGSPRTLKFGMVSGIRALVSRQMDGPWIVAATTN
jgi:hypothetical protein